MSPTKLDSGFLESFLKRHESHILARLEECDKSAQAVEKKSQDMIFFAESLPIINGLVHVGTTREELERAKGLVQAEQADLARTKRHAGGAASPQQESPDPEIVLSALVFVEVAARGKKKADQGKDPIKKEIWNRIEARVKKLVP